MIRTALVKTTLVRTLLGLALAGAASIALAQTVVTDPWARATVPGQPATGAFMTLTADTDSTLVAVASPVAKLVQVHQSSIDNDVMSMHQVQRVALPAGKPVVFDPSGYHVMLMQLNGQVKEGERVPLTLTIEDAKGGTQTVEVSAPVRALNGMVHEHGHGMKH
jgi:copper(I)-binding protein